jgi:ABC-2 type transport system ATP-binding protein
MAVGLLRPDAGSAQVLDHPVWGTQGGQQAKALLGVLTDGLALPQRLTAREPLTCLGLLRAIPAHVVDHRTCK